MTVTIVLAIVVIVVCGPVVLYQRVAAGIWEVYGGKLNAMEVARVGDPAVEHALADLARPYASPANASISADRAGAALHALTVWRDAPQRIAMLRPITPESANTLAKGIPAANPTRYAPVTWSRELIPLAASGLTSEQVAYLDSLTRSDPDTLVRVVAYAGAADVIGERYAMNVRPRAAGGALVLPVPLLGALRHAAQIRVARAALAIAHGNADAADTALRENVAMGIRLIDSGPDQADAQQGAVVLWEAMEAMITADSVRGRRQEAAKLRQDLSAALRSRAASGRGDRMTLYAADTGLVSLASRNDVPVGVRWTTLRYVTFRRAMRFCAGPTRRREWRAWEDSIRPLFARSPSETRFFAWVADPPSALACVRVFYSPPWSDSKPSKP